jgi:hypothetical protein
MSRNAQRQSTHLGMNLLVKERRMGMMLHKFHSGFIRDHHWCEWIGLKKNQVSAEDVTLGKLWIT